MTCILPPGKISHKKNVFQCDILLKVATIVTIGPNNPSRHRLLGRNSLAEEVANL